MNRLTGKTAIVTGAARGIGAAVARCFAAEGANVLLSDLLAEQGQATAAAIGDKAHFVAHDVSDVQQWQEVVATCKQRFGAVDILVNNAGIGGDHFETIETIAPERTRKMFEVNVFGTVFGMQAVIPAMAEAGSGSIVNMSSTAAILGMNSTAIYGGTKWAVLGLSKVAALELGFRGIRVNTVHPGGTDTMMANPGGAKGEEFDRMFSHVSMQRGCSPDEIASAVLFFASEEGGYCNGAELVVDGGQGCGFYMRMLPGAPPRKKG